MKDKKLSKARRNQAKMLSDLVRKRLSRFNVEASRDHIAVAKTAARALGEDLPRNSLHEARYYLCGLVFRNKVGLVEALLSVSESELDAGFREAMAKE